MQMLPALIALLLAQPPAVDEGPVLSGEHRALRKQVELLRAEVARPREFFDGDRARKLKAELATLEEVLAAVDDLHVMKVGQCQQPFLAYRARYPTEPMPGEFFRCLQEVMVSDEVVRAMRRRAEVKRRLADNSVPVDERKKLKAELLGLDARVDREAGYMPLNAHEMDRVVPVADGGVTTDGPPAR